MGAEAAATPARYEDCSAAKTMSTTFLAWMVESSIIPKVTFGYLTALSSRAILG